MPHHSRLRPPKGSGNQKSPSDMVAVDILTGYLGAGKTTLLRHALDHGLNGRRVAIVVNELGAVGIDGTLLAAPASVGRMVELTNGCVCCTIDEQRFDRAVVELVERTGADVVVVETTGVADPDALVGRLRRVGFRIDAITTVVDVAAFEDARRREPVVERQIAAADFVVLGKVDLASARTTRRVERAIAAINPRAVRMTAERGRVDPTLLFATGARVWRERAVRGTAADAHGIESFVVRGCGPVDVHRVEHVLRALPRGIVRAKGVLRAAGSGAHCVFNYASGRHELSWVEAPGLGDGQAVFIGREAGRHAGAIRAALNACVTHDGLVAEA